MTNERLSPSLENAMWRDDHEAVHENAQETGHEDVQENVHENVNEEVRENVHEDAQENFPEGDGDEDDQENVKEGVHEDIHEDVSSWIGSIADYVKNTRAKCLDLRNVSKGFFASVDTHIQPILDALADSEITELYMKAAERPPKIQDLFKVLPRTKIKKMNFCSCGLRVDDILSLMAILKHTQVTELVISVQLQGNEVDEFFAHLADSQVTSLIIADFRLAPFEKMSVFTRRLPDTKITCLGINGVIALDRSAHCEYRKDLSLAFISNIQHTALTDLDLRSNDLDYSLLKALGVALKNSNLEKLNLGFNHIDDSGVDALVPGLVCSKISHLKLFYNNIDGDNSLGHSLKHTKIRVLELNGNPLTNGRMFSGPNFLHGTSVDVLTVSFRCPRGRVPLPLPIRELRFSKLTCLDLNSSYLNSIHIAAVADVISHSSITHINLGDNVFSEECYGILGESLKRSVVKYIDLSSTASSENIQGIISFLDKTKGSSIVSLGLQCNRDVPSIETIATALANTTFLELDLSENCCKNIALSLASKLKFTSITALYLSLNNIDDLAAVTLAAHLDETQIVELDLGANLITNTGAKALAFVIQKTKLRHLNLEFNYIEEVGLESLVACARNSCITYLNVELNPGHKKVSLLLDQVLWGNRRKIQRFADLLEQTAFFNCEKDIFQFDRVFDDVDTNSFIEDHLKFYKMVSDDPFIANAIEQDKCLLDLKKHYRSDFEPCAKRDFSHMFQVFFKDCELIYNNIVHHPSPVKSTAEHHGVSFFKKQIHWLLFEYYPMKFVSFLGEHIEADLETHVSLLRKIEDRGLSSLVEALLLNRPLYMIDNDQEILHPYVYQLLSKYKRTICNTEIEPEGLTKIVEYFSSHIDLDGASEVISILNSSRPL